MLDHIILTVGDFARSTAFYNETLKPLGITNCLNYDGKDGHPDLKGFGKDGAVFFWLKEGKPDPASIHFGFRANSQAQVSAVYDAAIAVGGRNKSAPAAQLQYHPNYYAAWVFDPDGYDVEIVNKTGQVD